MIPCDHCHDLARARIHLIVDVTSHVITPDGRPIVARVRTRRHWCFCSDDCLSTWWASATEENFHEVGPIHTHVTGFAIGDDHTDQNFRVAAWRYVPGEVKPTLYREEKLADGHAVNAWWRAAE